MADQRDVAGSRVGAAAERRGTRNRSRGRLGLSVPARVVAVGAAAEVLRGRRLRLGPAALPAVSVLSRPAPVHRARDGRGGGALDHRARGRAARPVRASRRDRRPPTAPSRACSPTRPSSAPSQVVYHALALATGRRRARSLAAETRSLAALAALAERLGVTIAIENLAPLYPGPETLSATPIMLRGLVAAGSARRRSGSASTSATPTSSPTCATPGSRRCCEPVLDWSSASSTSTTTSAPAAGSPARELGVDPLRLDLHLPPGRGTLPWDRVAPMLAAGDAPLVLEVHPPYRAADRRARRRTAAPTAARLRALSAGPARPGARRPRTRGTGR